jgi:carbon monoxide dehydrogenase subunit G
MRQHHVFNLPHRVTAEVEIDAPIDQVFSYVTDPHNLVHWYQGVSDLRDVSDPTGVGQRFTFTAHFLGKRLEATNEVTDFEPITLYALRAVNGPYHGAEHFQFEQKNNGTRITVDLAVQDLHFLARLAEPLILRSARRHEQHSLETLKDLLETHGPDHAR